VPQPERDLPSIESAEEHLFVVSPDDSEPTEGLDLQKPLEDRPRRGASVDDVPQEDHLVAAAEGQVFEQALESPAAAVNVTEYEASGQWNPSRVTLKTVRKVRSRPTRHWRTAPRPLNQVVAPTFPNRLSILIHKQPPSHEDDHHGDCHQEKLPHGLNGLPTLRRSDVESDAQSRGRGTPFPTLSISSSVPRGANNESSPLRENLLHDGAEACGELILPVGRRQALPVEGLEIPRGTGKV